jgi:signal transduction histidine kinase
MTSRVADQNHVDDRISETDTEVQALRRRVCALEKEVDALSEAVAARDHFIATAAHELRNSMGSILVGVSNMAFRTQSEPLPLWLVERIAGLRRHATAFVRRATTLLDVSRITSDNVRLEPELVDLTQIVRDCLGELADEAARAGCTFDPTLDESVVGWWDRAALEQVTLNLVSNAVKYGGGGPVEIRLSSAEATAELSVRDHGGGISDEDRVRVFERFERAVRRSESAGFGLGLWISRQLVVAHRGEIAVSNAAGRGSIFTVALPRGITGDPR